MKEIKLTLAKQIKDVVYMKTEAARFLDVNYVSESVAYRVNLVLEEVVTNIIRHGTEEGNRNPIHLFLALRGKELVIEVVWKGLPFNPVLSIKNEEEDLLKLDTMESQQFGAHVVQKLCKSSDYHRNREENENILNITMRSGLH